MRWGRGSSSGDDATIAASAVIDRRAVFEAADCTGKMGIFCPCDA
jgi:hypothetical protein